MSKHSLPILDFAQFRQGGEAQQSFLTQLLEAANSVGFFYLTNHGIEQSLIDEMFRVSKAFFDLPIEERLEIQMIHSPHFRGYTRLNDEITLGKPDAREQFDFMPERDEIPLDEIPNDQPWLRAVGPNQWPNSLPTMKETLLSWQQRETDLAIELLGAFALALGQPQDIFSETLQNPSVLSKVIHYPSVEESTQGVGAHKDSGYLTFVCQDEHPGLEVLIDDQWVLAEIIPGTFVVNIGELLELASNGYLKATLHRVTTPESGISRFSSAFFLTAQLDTTVPLLELPELLSRENRSLTADPNNPLFYKIGQNFLKSRLRSHPDVAERHYSDLNIDAL